MDCVSGVRAEFIRPLKHIVLNDCESALGRQHKCDKFENLHAEISVVFCLSLRFSDVEQIFGREGESIEGIWLKVLHDLHYAVTRHSLKKVIS